MFGAEHSFLLYNVHARMLQPVLCSAAKDPANSSSTCKASILSWLLSSASFFPYSNNDCAFQLKPTLHEKKDSMLQSCISCWLSHWKWQVLCKNFLILLNYSIRGGSFFFSETPISSYLDAWWFSWSLKLQPITKILFVNFAAGRVVCCKKCSRIESSPSIVIANCAM